MRVYTVLAVLLSLAFSRAQVLERETCDSSRMQVNIDTANADAIIGGIFDIRQDEGQGCGTVDPEVILSYEAALWAMRKINQDNYIPGIRLGMQAYDNCWSAGLGLSVANQLVPKFSTNSLYCNDTQQIFLGVLGPIISEITKPIARMLSSYKVSMISQGSSSPELSDKFMYPYFLRTTTSISEQNKAMMDAMGALGWERVLLVYMDNDLARESMREFVRLSEKNNVCIVGGVELMNTRNINQLRDALTNIEKYNTKGAVFIGSGAEFERVMSALDGLPATADIQWMATNADVERTPSSQSVRGATFVQPSFLEVPEFYEYFKTIDPNNPPADNPWFQEWFMVVFQCRLVNVNYAPYNTLSQCTSKTQAQVLQAANTKYPYVDSTIKAVYTFANALKNAQRATCGFNGFCLGLQQMTTETFHGYLSSVDFDFSDTNINSLQGERVAFDFNGDYINTKMMFWNYNDQPSGQFSWKNIGYYDNNGLNIDVSQLYMYDTTGTSILNPLPSSRCPAGGCQNCLVDRMPVHFSYMPGDLVIAGLFDLHRQGSEVLTCGSLKASHAVNAAAFRYAIQRAKQNFPNILNGVELGSLMIDMCDNAEIGRMFMNNLLGGRKFVTDMYGQVVDPNLVKSTVGELDSTEASAMAVQHGLLGMPYLESSATSITLSDREMFPTFSRVVPSDYHQMLAIVLMLKRMEWTYVQVIHTNDAYGINGYNVLKKEGAKRSICISAVHEYEDAEMVVKNLNNKPQATVVVAIVDTDDFRALLTEVQNQGAQGKFVMIGTETWGRRQSVVAGLESVARGSITLDFVSPDMGNFRSWLAQFRPDNMDTIKEMPFFREWYETSFNCYIDATSRGMYQQPCTNYRSITEGSGFAMTSSYTTYLMSATYATAQALDKTLREFCGNAYNGICSNFRSDPMVQKRLLYHIQNMEFSLAGFNTLIEEGDGKQDYAFYSYDNGYTRLGTYDTKSEQIVLTQFPLSLPANFQSQCTQTCTECVYLLQTSPYMIIPGPELKIGTNFGFSNPDMNDPFLCTNTRITNGAQSGLALHYALNVINSGNGPVTLNNVRVGALGFDHCNSAARANGLPSALYSGLLEAPNEPETQPNLNSIRAWMTDNTLVTEQMKDFFTALNLPVISPMAVNNQFLDEDEYPTFLRTIQGDNTIASALTTLAKSLGFSHVTLLYSANDYGRSGMDVFKMIAMQDGVCVVKSMEFDPANAQGIVQDLIGASSHVVVTYLGLADMDAFLQARGNNVDGGDLVVLTPEPYPLVFNRRGLSARNVLSLRIKSSGMTGYMDWISSLTMDDIVEGDSDVLKVYYMELFQCNLPGEYKYPTACTGRKIVDSPDFFQDNYVLPIINAVYTFVHAAHETLKAKCGDDYSGVCTFFYLDPSTNTVLLQKMLEANFVDPSGASFEFIGREGNIGREIVYYDGSQTKMVADFAGASINFFERSFVSTFDSTLSSCPPPCTECINNMMNFTYIPGDLLLGGIFDVHNNDILPFSCGTINTLHGFQLLEAFHFAINEVNDKSGKFANILKNIKLGGIGLDACSNAVRAGYLVSNIHSGLTVLQRDGDTIDPDTIEAYVGTYRTGQSIHLARLLKSLEIPQISFGATATSLLDQDRYPYFMRTVPADNRQAMAMIAYLQKYNIRYVQILHITDEYGEQGAAIFRSLAQERQICIAQTISFQDRPQVTRESANEVVLGLLEKPIANTVIVFADTDHVNAMLQAVRRNPDAINKFKFLGSDTWANNPEATEGVEDLAEGSVTIDLDVKDLRVFDDYLETKSPSNYPENPWFPEYYEEIQNCYLTIPKLRFPAKCSAATVPVVKSSRYKQDTVIIHVINAVYSAAIGLDMALRQECGENYTTVCEAYRNRDKRRELVFNKTLQAEFTDLSDQEFSFADSRDGNKGYVLYSVDKANVRGYVYNPIARFSSEEVFDSIDLYQPSWDGSCNRVDSCTECPTIRNPLTRYMLTANNNPANQNPATVIVTMSVHNQGNDAYRCGSMHMNQFIRGLSFIYAIQNVLPNRRFDLRTLLLDNCNNALRVDQDLFNMLSKGSLCNSRFETNDGSRIDVSSVVGVHTTSSRFVVAANRVTNPYMIQVTSSSASSAALSETFSYPYFARMVPPDNVQMEAVAKVLQENGWTYVAVLYSLESYGINGFRALRDVSNEKQYSCVGFAEGIRQSSSPDEIRAVLRRMAEEDGIGVIVIISVEPRAILQAIVDEGLASRYLVIGTDAWGTLGSVTDGLWQHFRGAITISFRDSYYLDFMDWVAGITYTNRKGIPDAWFEEFYQHIHRCKLADSTVIQTQYTDLCTKNMIITTDRIREYDVGVRDIAAAYAIGSGLFDFERRVCNTGETFASCMNRVQDSRKQLFGRTLEVDWTINRLDVSPRDEYRLLIGEKRYWNIGYNIYTLKDGNQYEQVGSWSDIFTFNKDLYNTNKPDLVSKCPIGTVCDCSLEDGSGPQPVVSKYQKPIEPRNYFMYDEDTGSQTYTWPIWAIAVAVLTCLGLLIGLILFFYFLIAYPVRGGTTALGFMMMIGVFGIYAINFAFFLPASDSTCGARQACLGIVYAIVFAALFVKAVDNWRFKDSEYSTDRYRGFSNPLTLITIAIGIVLVQCIIPAEWLILKNPSASLMDDATNQHDWMWCDPHDFYDLSLVLSMSFVVFLVILTAVFAALAWDSESNYFESRWIFVSCVCTAGCFLVWMVVTTNAGPPNRDPAIAIANFVNATALLIFIPLRKLILLIQFQSEEEKLKMMPIDDMNTDVYSTVYTNRVYQSDAFTDSKQGSENGYS